jgi:hypothetical protein
MIAAGVLPLEEQLTRTVLIIQNKFWWFWGFELPAVTDHDRFSSLYGGQQVRNCALNSPMVSVRMGIPSA